MHFSLLGCVLCRCSAKSRQSPLAFSYCTPRGSFPPQGSPEAAWRTARGPVRRPPPPGRPAEVQALCVFFVGQGVDFLVIMTCAPATGFLGPSDLHCGYCTEKISVVLAVPVGARLPTRRRARMFPGSPTGAVFEGREQALSRGDAFAHILRLHSTAGGCEEQLS